MTEWLPLLLPLLAAIGVLLGLGLPISLALKVRGFMALVVAIPAAFAVLALAAIAAGFLSVGWSVLAPLVITAGLTVVFAVAQRWFQHDSAAGIRSQRVWMPIGAAAIGGGLIGTYLLIGLGRADAISQTYDAIFHLNAVQQILETRNPSPFAMDLSNPGNPTFYPTVWHSFVALVVQLTGVSIPLATNAVLATVAAFVWPIGIVAFGRAMAGPSIRVTIISGILAAAFPNFPLSLSAYGVLYPNLLSLSILPFVFVGIMHLLALGRARTSDPIPLTTAWLLTLGAVGSSILAHPSSIHTVALWFLFPAFAAARRAFKNGRIHGLQGKTQAAAQSVTLRRARSGVGLFLLAAVCVAAWYFGRTGDNGWSGKHGPRSALLDAFGMTPHIQGHSWVLSVLVLAGAIVLVTQRRHLWILGIAFIFLVFYYIADGFPPGAWRTLFLSPWYNDPWRLAALVPIATFPLALYGASTVAAFFSQGARRFARVFRARGTLPKWAIAACGALLLIAAVQSPVAQLAGGYLKSTYKFDDSSPLLSPDEFSLLERLPSQVPEGATIINNPWNGGALAYAIADRKVLTPHTGGNYDPRNEIVVSGIASGDPISCEAASELDAEYLLDFGTHYVFAGTDRAEPFSDISGVSDPVSLEEVDREGAAVLYKVDCAG